jgi:hypothetical protein
MKAWRFSVSSITVRGCRGGADERIIAWPNCNRRVAQEFKVTVESAQGRLFAARVKLLSRDFGGA